MIDREKYHRDQAHPPGRKSQVSMWVWYPDEETRHEMRTHKPKRDNDDWNFFYRRFDPQKNQWDLFTRPIPNDVPDFHQILKEREASAAVVPLTQEPSRSQPLSVSSAAEYLPLESPIVSSVSEYPPSASSFYSSISESSVVSSASYHSFIAHPSSISNPSSLHESELDSTMESEGLEDGELHDSNNIIQQPPFVNVLTRRPFEHTKWACSKDLETNLYSRFGYSPVDTKVPARPHNSIPWDGVLRCIGHKTAPNVTSNTQGGIANFINNLMPGSNPATQIVANLDIAQQDIADNALYPLMEHASLGFNIAIFKWKNITHYGLVSKDKDIPQPHWQLILTDAAAVIQCLREDLGSSLVEAARFLFSSGIPFNTYMDIFESPPATEPYSEYTLGYRPPSHKPTMIDYSFYQELRARFMQRPYARSALLRGGIIWRLATDCVEDTTSMEYAAIAGPSDDVVHYGEPLSYGSRKLYDDSLTDTEKELICGVYKIYTSKLYPILHFLSF